MSSRISSDWLRSILKRVGSFMGLPFVAALAPFLLLPVLARASGPAGWASIYVGQSIGAMACVVIPLGWWEVGPARYASKSIDQRKNLYVESVATRALTFAAVAPPVVILSALLAQPGWRWESALMAIGTAAAGMSPTWFFVAEGNARSVFLFDTLPRTVAVILSTLGLLVTAVVWIYPFMLTVAAFVGLFLGSHHIMRRSTWVFPSLAGAYCVIRQQGGVALINALGALTSGLALPLASGLGSVSSVASLTSSQRLYRISGFFVQGAGNGLVGWVLESKGTRRRSRHLFALAFHALIGMVGGLLIALFGPPLTAVLFGEPLAADRSSSVAFGFAVLIVSLWTPIYRNLVVPSGMIRNMLRGRAAGAAVGIPAMILLGVNCGVQGVAWGYMISEAVFLIFAVVVSQRVLRDLRR